MALNTEARILTIEVAEGMHFPPALVPFVSVAGEKELDARPGVRRFMFATYYPRTVLTWCAEVGVIFENGADLVFVRVVDNVSADMSTRHRW